MPIVAGRAAIPPGNVTWIRVTWEGLADAEEVSETVVTADPPSDLAASPVPITVDAITTFWRQNGTSTASTTFNVKITTNYGRILNRAVIALNEHQVAGSSVVTASMGDKIPISVDWTCVLESDESITDEDVVAVYGGVVASFPVPITVGAVVEFWADGSSIVAPVTATFLMTIETSLGRTLSQQIILKYK
jgi:hypothetical protein